MENYPQDLADLEARFGDEAACLNYLTTLRWPDGFVCPKCGSLQGWHLAAGRYECASCKRQTSVTSGTIFHRTRSPLSVWFRAIWWVVSQKNGASALGLQRVLGLGSYETAWLWLHKLRRAMIRPGRDRLTGDVEIDETIIGGLEEGVYGRETYKKTLVVIAAECRGNGIGRVRIAHTRDASGRVLAPVRSQ